MAQHPTLSAQYSSPSQSHEVAIPLDIPTDPQSAHNPHLTLLRTSIVDLQSQINTLLTRLMDEDKATAGEVKSGGVDEDTAEQNYGEEVVDGDA